MHVRVDASAGSHSRNGAERSFHRRVGILRVHLVLRAMTDIRLVHHIFVFRLRGTDIRLALLTLTVTLTAILFALFALLTI